MNSLTINKPTLDSREVAEMVGVKHYQILEKLEGTKTVKGIIPTLTDHKIMVSDYFLLSTYVDGSGKENKCYLFTKMGCEFIANKFTGEIGISKADEDYELVKQRVLIKLGATKWEDIPVETLRDSLNVIDESIRVIKADRTTNQISFFEVACN